MLYVRKVGVVGAGAMGSQIAEIMAFNGYEVYLKDVAKEFLDRGMAGIRKNLDDLVSFHKSKADKEIARIRDQDGVMLNEEQAGQVRAKLKPTYDEKRVSEVLSRIHPSETFEPFREVDLVIEAIIEEIEEKKKLFRELDQIVKTAVLASNTSTLSITQIASATRRRNKIIGTHFFNPPITLPLIEVIPGLETSEDTAEDVFDFLSSLRNFRYPMVPIKVKEVPGFLVNRVLGAMWNEAFALYEEGVASFRDIDQAMKTGAGMPMGPFELADLVGLDVMYHVEESIKHMEGSYLTPRPTQIVKKMYYSGRLGRKTGKGFYNY
ncbi:MAG TPA: 3-hydroxyacyl-CoA dehydrogenase family protein [Nitrososphaerales archaeon]|nr:3-hydroxyacyl-CoA dehydrogenase family protein [Nitrososphaerales archaeon]